jgi:hypothetical protein
MKNFKKLMITGLFVMTGMTANLFCVEPIIFKNTLDQDVTYTGPKGNLTFPKKEDYTIQNPASDTVSYTLTATGYDVITDTAKAGKKYKIYKDGKKLKVKEMLKN